MVPAPITGDVTEETTMAHRTDFDEHFGGEEAGQGDPATASVVVLPVPLEATVSYGGGTAAGPGALLRASGELEFIEEETGEPYWGAGEVATLPPLPCPETQGDTARAALIESITDAARPVLARDAFLLTLGGEHALTTGPYRAAAEVHDDLAIVGIDAHLDLRDTYEGTPWSHACVLRRIVDEFSPRVLWVGARSLAAEERDFLKTEPAIDVRWAHAIAEEPDRSWIDRAIAPLPEKVYLTIDVDGLDPSIIPGTGTPEPGGLDYRTVLAFVRALAAQRTIVAADVVELAPIEGQQGSEFTSAKLAAKLVAAVLAART